MIALSLKLLFALFFLFSFVRPSFAQEYFFQEEFNVDRPGGVIDSEKWIVYPNKDSCSIDTIKEVAGFLLLKQCLGKPQFPYVISKNDPFPDSSFSVSVKFEYLKAAPWGNGIEFVDKAPGNGEGFTQLFGIGFWEDTSSGLNMRFQFKGEVVYKTSINRNPHIFRLDKEGSVYKMFLDDQLLFTSPSTQEKVHAIYLGNPSVQSPPISDWSWFRVDYIRVVQTGPTEIVPEPFLDLPWDYQSQGKKLEYLIYRPFSWFDHKYPLQNFCCDPPVINYTGQTKDFFYKSHSGYDYSAPQGIVENSTVLAAAGGIATFLPESLTKGAGNMIKIDHGNGYQTWYEHLRKLDTDTPADHQLVVSEVGKQVSVKKGQPIGLVGLSGNTTGYHIHLSVFKDINENGDFSDDYPFGLTDPLGWDGDYMDPWEEYVQGGKHGAKSYKLFTGLTPPKDQQIPPSGGNIVADEFTLKIPPEASSDTLNVNIKDGPFDKASETIKSIVPSLFLSATNNLGQAVSNFSNPLELIYDYSGSDLSNINEDTISFYYFNPVTSLWEKLSSFLDKNNKTISSETSHFSQFAVMAELLDTTPPVTNAELAGDRGTGSWYRSDVSVSLVPEDNPGGKGVGYTVYSFNGDHWEKYENPLEFKNEGTYKVWFLSHDMVGNEESKKSIEFSIDKTIPEAKIFADPNDSQIKVTAEPEDSGEVTVQKNQNKATYNITDPAGNNLEIAAEMKENGTPEEMKILSLKYNSDPPVQLPKNSFSTDFISRPSPKTGPELIRINQFFEMEGQGRYIIFADAKKNMTKIDYFNGRVHTSEEKSGIVLLNLLTDKGKIKALY